MALQLPSGFWEGAGTDQYNHHWRKAYSDRVLALSQFRKSKLIPVCENHGGIMGEMEYVDVIGKSTGVGTGESGTVGGGAGYVEGGFTQITDRHARQHALNDPGDAAYSTLPDDWELVRQRRRFDPYDISYHYYWDEKDARRMMRSIGPTSTEASNVVGMYQEEVEAYIYTSIHGTAKGGDDGDTDREFGDDTGGTPLTDFEDTAGVDTSDPDAPLTLNRILTGCEVLMGRNVPDESSGVPWYIIVHPKDLHELLRNSDTDARVASADYAAVRALVERKISYFLGLNWIVTTGVQTDPAMGSSNDVTGRYATILTGTCMGWKQGKGLASRIEQIPLRRYSYQVYYDACVSAVRLHDDQCYRIECTQPD